MKQPISKHMLDESVEPVWMEGFGKLAHLRDENQRILQIIEDEFEGIELDDDLPKLNWEEWATPN